MNRDSNILRRNIIRGWRKRKDLCLLCGKYIHDGECEENYIKVDLRDGNVEKEIDQNKRKDTILSYRRKKSLCELVPGDARRFTSEFRVRIEQRFAREGKKRLRCAVRSRLTRRSQ